MELEWASAGASGDVLADVQLDGEIVALSVGRGADFDRLGAPKSWVLQSLYVSGAPVSGRGSVCSVEAPCRHLRRRGTR
jgi:hypothetical protein